MELNIYTIYDQKAKAYLQPFFLTSDGQAIRMFMDNINSKDENTISNHPADYTLFKIGHYNDHDGHIESLPPRPMGNGLEYMTDNSPISAIQTQITDIQEMLEILIAPNGKNS